MEYRADQRDIAFQLFDWLPTEELLGDEQFGDWDRESVEMAIAEAARIAREELAPGNEEGDRQGARLDGGEVTLPESFQSGYSTVAEGGWVGSTSST